MSMPSAGEPITRTSAKTTYPVVLVGDFVLDVHEHLPSYFVTRDGCLFSLDQEGRTWVRGHIDQESIEAQALIAAATLYNI